MGRQYHKILWFILFLIFLVQFSNCYIDWPKPKPLTELEKLPPITHLGKNTIGCLINNKAWVSDYLFDVQAFYQHHVLQISGKILNPLEEISFILSDSTNLILKGTYPLVNGSPFNPQVNVSLSNGCEYGRDSTEILSGELIISTFDMNQYIFCGQFEFTATTDYCDTLKITNGRFDIEIIL